VTRVLAPRGITLVPFCSICRNRPMTQLQCPAPRWGGSGGNLSSGADTSVATSDVVGISNLSFAPSSSLSVEPYVVFGPNGTMTLVGSEGEER
jgi:hypothetical protein